MYICGVCQYNQTIFYILSFTFCVLLELGDIKRKISYFFDKTKKREAEEKERL